MVNWTTVRLMLILSTILKLDVPSRVCVLSTIRVLNMRLGICKMLAWQNLDLPSLCKAASDKNGGLASIGLTFMISHWLVCCWVESCFVVGVVGGIVVCLLSEEQGIFVHVLTSLEFDGHSSINELEIICDGSAQPPKSQSHTHGRAKPASCCMLAITDAAIVSNQRTSSNDR